MIKHRCHKCEWWDNVHPSVQFIPPELAKDRPGYCRRRRPGVHKIDKFYYAVQPVTDAEEFCGEFSEEK